MATMPRWRSSNSSIAMKPPRVRIPVRWKWTPRPNPDAAFSFSWKFQGGRNVALFLLPNVVTFDFFERIMTMRKHLFLLPVLAVAACGPSDRCEAPSQPALLSVKNLTLTQKADAMGVPPSQVPRDAVGGPAFD